MSQTYPTIKYDPKATLIPHFGISQDDLDWIAPRMAEVQRELLNDETLWQSGGPVPEVKKPLDAGFIRMPHRLLDEYEKDATGSELGRIIATADRLAESSDRVVSLGIGGSYMGARALMEACCHPYHNELDRAARGNRPRLYFEGNNVDNDAITGLVELLEADADPFSIVVISKSGGTLETAASFRIFLDLLRKKIGPKALAERVVPVTGDPSKLRSLCTAIGCDEKSIFPIPDGVGGRFSILSAVGLLPAAILGLDIVKLLEGAAQMTDQFVKQPFGSNVVLDYLAVCHLLEARRGMGTRVLSTWGKGMEALGLWYDQLLAESIGKDGQGALPLTAVNTRDLHSRGQQHQEGKRDKLITNLITEKTKYDAVALPKSDLDQDKLNELAGKPFPEIMSAAIAGTNRAYAEDNRPTADMTLPKLDEPTLGQMFQMFMLATVAEGRLIGINPYGQPGVEAYKRHMNEYLRK
jgi:glucose-6-phosphate isomerase